MASIDHGKVERALDTEDGLDPSDVADLNKTETLVAVLERLDIGYVEEELEDATRVPHGELRRILSAVVGLTDDRGEGGE